MAVELQKREAPTPIRQGLERVPTPQVRVDSAQLAIDELERVLRRKLAGLRYIPASAVMDAMQAACQRPGATRSEVEAALRDLTRNKDDGAVTKYVADQLRSKLEIAKTQATACGQQGFVSGQIYRKQLDDLGGDLDAKFGVNGSVAENFVMAGLTATSTRVTELPWPVKQAVAPEKPGFFDRLFGRGR